MVQTRDYVSTKDQLGRPDQTGLFVKKVKDNVKLFDSPLIIHKDILSNTQRWNTTTWNGGIWYGTLSTLSNMIRVVNNNNTFNEKFVTDDLKVSATGTWNTTNQQLVIGNGELFHYPMNGNSNDNSLNEYDGTDTNITYTTGKIGQCAVLNGSNGYINLGNDSRLDFTGAFSIACWVKVAVDASGYIISKNISSAADNQYAIWYNISTKKFTTIMDGVNGATSDAISLDTWYHLVFVMDDSAVERFYLNGVASGTTNSTTFTTSTNYDVNIGRRHPNNFYLAGNIDDFRIYNRALTTDEIAIIYNSGTGTEDLLNSSRGYYFMNVQNITNSKIIVTGETDNALLYLSSDDGSNFELVSNNVKHGFTNVGQNGQWKIIASGGTVTADKIIIEYNK